MKTQIKIFILFLIPALSFGQTVVESKEIIDKINHNESVIYQNATINGKLDFTAIKNEKLISKSGNHQEFRSYVKSPVKFVNCKFLDDVLAYYSLDEKNEVHNASFDEEVIFENCTFLKKSTFKYSSFAKNASFEKSTFKEEALFKYSKFAYGPDFRGVKFEDGAIFKYANFPKGVNFSEATFSQTADFKYAEFPDGASFKNTRFNSHADFKYTNFSEPLDITGIEFNGSEDFKYTEVDGKSFSKYLLGKK